MALGFKKAVKVSSNIPYKKLHQSVFKRGKEERKKERKKERKEERKKERFSLKIHI